MFELIFLGTAAAVPSAKRGLPVTLVSEGPNRFLIDCGEGTQRQLLRSELGLGGLNAALLTHAHLGHETLITFDNLYDASLAITVF